MMNILKTFILILFLLHISNCEDISLNKVNFWSAEFDNFLTTDSNNLGNSKTQCSFFDISEIEVFEGLKAGVVKYNGERVKCDPDVSKGPKCNFMGKSQLYAVFINTGHLPSSGPDNSYVDWRKLSYNKSGLRLLLTINKARTLTNQKHSNCPVSETRVSWCYQRAPYLKTNPDTSGIFLANKFKCLEKKSEWMLPDKPHVDDKPKSTISNIRPITQNKGAPILSQSVSMKPIPKFSEMSSSHPIVKSKIVSDKIKSEPTKKLLTEESLLASSLSDVIEINDEPEQLNSDTPKPVIIEKIIEKPVLVPVYLGANDVDCTQPCRYDENPIKIIHMFNNKNDIV